MTTPTDNPLLRPLTDDEQLLLDLIAAPTFLPMTRSVKDIRWPLWAWVADQFDRRNPDGDPAAVLAALPTVPPYLIDAARPYGLTWTDAATDAPAAGDRIGLSIAGLARIDVSKVAGRFDRVGVAINPDLVTNLVHALRDMAAYEQQHVRATPNSAGDHNVELRRFTGPIDNNPAFISTDSIGETFSREYFPTGVSGGGVYGPLIVGPYDEAPEPIPWTVSMAPRRLRHYRGLDSPAEYLAAIAAHTQRTSLAPPFPATPVPAPVTTPEPHDPARDRHLDVEALDVFHAAVGQRPKVRSLWATGHHLEAVGDANRHLEARLAALARRLGAAPRNPVDVLSPSLGKLDVAITTRSADDERRGVHQLALGLFAAVRNPRSHEDDLDDSGAEAFEYLAICSTIHRHLDLAEGKLNRPPSIDTTPAEGQQP